MEVIIARFLISYISIGVISLKDEAKYWKEQYENLKEQYEELETVINLSVDQITIADGNGVFTKISKAALERVGLMEDEIVGKSAFELEKKGVFDISSTAEVIRRKQKVRFIQKIKGNKIILVTGFPFFDENNNIKKIINISYDITEKKALEKQLSETESTLQWYKNEVQLRSQRNTTIYTENKNMETIRELLNAFANMDILIMLLGDTGVGKTYAANYIHNISQRKKEPFIAINCGAIPEQLMESELFGYEKGSFTGALNQGKEGLLQVARNGTLFLDEISELPIGLQVKLLSVLDNKRFRKIGGHEEIELKARIIVATNKDLEKCVENGTFREDLYYRINILPIRIPSLAERREDIPTLVDNFLKMYNEKYGFDKKISPAAYESLLQYNYPGNIRELKNIIERLIIVSKYSEITADDVHKIIKFNNLSHGNNEKKEIQIVSLKEGVANFERQLLIEVAKKYKSTRDQARVLGVDQSTIVKKRQKYSIK